MSKTFKAYHELCKKYLCEDNIGLMNIACDHKIYMDIAEVNEACIKLHVAKAQPQAIDMVIATNARFKFYFDSEEDGRTYS